MLKGFIKKKKKKLDYRAIKGQNSDLELVILLGKSGCLTIILISVFSALKYKH